MLNRFWCGIVAYFMSLWDLRYYWMSLVQSELRRRYRRSIIGLGWSLLQPLSMTVVLALVYRRLFNISFWDFAPFLLCGLAFWGMISQLVLQGCASLVTAEAYIRQQPLPLAIFPLRTVLTVGFHFLVSLALTLGFVCVLHRGFPNPLALLSLIPTLVLLFFFGWSLSLLAGFAHVYFPDTQHLAEVGLQVVMFLTPVMYPASLLQQNGLEFLLHYNPLAVMLEMVRDPVLRGTVPSLYTYGVASLFVSVPMACSCWVVSRLEHRVIFAL